MEEFYPATNGIAPNGGLATPISVAANRFSASTLKNISQTSEKRITTGLSELDNVLSGGIVEGSLTLLGGDPGIGKSTLLLQICQNVGSLNHNVLYVSGEESLRQLKLRADRLNVTTDNLQIAAETDLNVIYQIIAAIKPHLLIIDSIQTMTDSQSNSVAGSVSQIRACTHMLMKIAKTQNIAVLVIGHVTKEGTIAGPRVMEHMVDTVLYFEGERRENYRVIRAVKNRFGGTNEIGLFEMGERGLSPVDNPSLYMLSGRPTDTPGSAITCAIEGSRPILAEVQALLIYTTFGTPRRSATGFDYNRAVMLLAVLEKHAGLQLSNCDCYINLAGGIRLAEPALDAAVIVAAASGFRNKPTDPFTVAFGEVGLAGEIRAVSNIDKRIAEAEKMGFKTCVIPKDCLRTIKKTGNTKNPCRILGAANVNELLAAAIL
jgi:DNA repair protein RadA/Sms